MFLSSFPLRVEEHEESGSLVLTLTMPGLDPEQDVEVTVADGALEVCVERLEEATTDEDGVTRTERHFGSFRRSVPLPAGTDAEDITANYNDGVLANPHAHEQAAADTTCPPHSGADRSSGGSRRAASGPGIAGP